ncbi:hypothetical protein I0C86_01705 [Plantactinospora sp. S1510]|uniref:Uncharacterized protein n=1 Tax=Plantactinospora alkalitolerans TaxID=2789879 RepID=A0ABS0GNF5_9ACTN|nr:hypothetical protein [Plantactinospora alkalitolerans]MBF9127717.1 hypothetical protein [Plantactinospora alkalitolerans]
MVATRAVGAAPLGTTSLLNAVPGPAELDPRDGRAGVRVRQRTAVLVPAIDDSDAGQQVYAGQRPVLRSPGL